VLGKPTASPFVVRVIGIEQGDQDVDVQECPH
jgi:hypothetical protein